MWVDNFLEFVRLGIFHILPWGFDHVLFVVAMCLSARSTRMLLLQITSFTFAHTLTLGLAAAGWITVSSAIVEPLIALSIAVVALEAALLKRPHQWKLAVTFGFGLFHGLGFASQMKELLHGADFITALFGFNVGVEIGQLLVLALTGAVLGAARYGLARAGQVERYQPLLVTPLALAIALTGLVWTVQRTAFA
jgi:hypothetical protein